MTILFVGIILSLILFIARFGAVCLATVRSQLTEEKAMMTVLLTRGLAAAVLATLPLQYVAKYIADPTKYPEADPIFERLASYYINLAIIVILATAIIATVGVPVLKRRAKR
ncbi:hypothetical protein HXY32_07090 [Candidatus Bathyarchaeota archaeon]|nr:hypothetical protein [Candidatus Bathyarchaeota archaeon]